MWSMICKGLNVPTNEEEWNENHLKQIQANSKAINMLYCSMNKEDFKNISKCSMANEIWDKLEQMYGERRKEEEIEEKHLENQCSTNDKVKDEESSGSQSSNEKESCFMAFEELVVTSNSCNSNFYTLMSYKMFLRN